MKALHLEAAKLLHKAIESPDFPLDKIVGMLERPKSEEHGDIAFPCFQLAKALGKAPPLIAKDLVGKLEKNSHFEKVQELGPYLNFTLSTTSALSFALSVEDKKQNFGKSENGNGKKILLEYSSPNVAKELHIGHFRNTILGQALCNIFRMTGHEVISLNHLGDWGSQFGKVAYGYLNYGNEEDMKKDPLGYLTKLYVKVNAEEEANPKIADEARLLFKKIEEKDPKLTALWEKFCAVSIEGLKLVYDRLGVKFDHFIGESFYVDKIPALLNDLNKQRLLIESEGALVVEMPDDQPPCLIVTRDGTSLYATRDIAAARWRKDHFKFDQCFYVVGSEQQLHLKQVFLVLEKMGYEWSKDLQHISYGLYRFKDGKFSTRKGRVILAEDVLNEAKDKVTSVIQSKNPNLANADAVAEIVGVGAVIFNDLSTDRIKDVEFDWDQVLDFEGDTGPYLQYSYARSSSILRQGKELGFSPSTVKEWNAPPAAMALMKQFGRLETSLDAAERLCKPSIIANYAVDLAKSFNGFYRQVKVLDKTLPPQEVAFRLGMVSSFRQVMEITLGLLCMKAPEEM